MVRIFRNKPFTRYAKRHGIEDAQLREAIGKMNAGLYDADLGGGVYKQRIARQGEGESGGFRAIVILRIGDHAFFVHCFAKNDRGNIDVAELRAFKAYARELFRLNNRDISTALSKRILFEVPASEDKDT